MMRIDLLLELNVVENAQIADTVHADSLATIVTHLILLSRLPKEYLGDLAIADRGRWICIAFLVGVIADCGRRMKRPVLDDVLDAARADCGRVIVSLPVRCCVDLEE